MKKEERIKRVNCVAQLLGEARTILNHIVFEDQEGQPDHFDKLQKLEQVMLCSCDNSVRLACNTLTEMVNAYKFCNFKETDE